MVINGKIGQINIHAIFYAAKKLMALTENN
jgi:hypothetical protein